MHPFIVIIVALSFLPETSTAKSCQEYQSCAEVIADHPNGYFGLRDRDQDGIPCENVCRSKKQVDNLLDEQPAIKPKKQPAPLLHI